MQTLAPGEEDCFDREDESSLAGPRRELGPRNALSGTVSRSNFLNHHRSAVILGISPLALSRFAPSWSVEMTDKCVHHGLEVELGRELHNSGRRSTYYLAKIRIVDLAVH